MAKKGKKSNRSSKKPHLPSSSPASLPPEQSVCGSPSQSVSGGCDVACSHLEKGINITALSSQLMDPKSALTQCLDCMKIEKSKKGKKAKGKPPRRRMVQSPSSHPMEMWICLTCGHIGCASSRAKEADENGKEAGMGTGHARKHWLYAKHHLALLVCEDKFACWCFHCNAFTGGARIEGLPDPDSQEEKHLTVDGQLQHVVNVIRDKLAKESGKVKKISLHCSDRALDNATLCKAASDQSLLAAFQAPIPSLDGDYLSSQRMRVVRGLVNLGNTCFFNAVMQNLLALNLLQDYFCQECKVMEGPLTSSLRKLFLETNDSDSGLISKRSGQVEVIGFESGFKRAGKGRMSCDSGSGTAYNPRSLFGAICSNAPRFRGFQQQDSHELLRCLLDGLHTEEQGTLMELADPAGINKDAGTEETYKVATFVDRFFGGQLSSRVSCCKCGYSSVVYEPFLDLSLPIPANHSSKKNPEKKMQVTPNSLARKMEKRKNRRYLDKGTSPCNSQSSTPVKIGEPSLTVTNDSEESQLHLVPSAVATHVGSSAMLENLDFQNSNAIDNFGWLDYLEGGVQSAEGLLQGLCNITVNEQCSGKPNACTNKVDAPQGDSSLSCTNLISCSPVILNEDMCFCSPCPRDATRPEVLCTEEIVGNVNRHERDCIGGFNASESRQDMDIEIDTEVVVNKETKSTEKNKSRVALPSASEVVLLPCSKLQSIEEDKNSSLALPSEVILLPYEKLQLPYSNAIEETSSRTGNSHSDLCCSINEDDIAQGEAGFDGFSHLFAEEESSASANNGRNGGKSLNDGGQESAMDAIWGALGSDHLEEESDILLPMSLESCLADFTKSELLSGEDAWECANCCRSVSGESFPTATYVGHKGPLRYQADLKALKEKVLEKEKSSDHKGNSELIESDVSSLKGFPSEEVLCYDVNDFTVTKCGTSLSNTFLEDRLIHSMKEKGIGCCKRDARLTRVTEVDLKFGNGFSGLNENTGYGLSAQQSPLTTMASGFVSYNGNISNNLQCFEENNALGGLNECKERYNKESGSKEEACGDFDEANKEESTKSSEYREEKLDRIDTRDSCSGASSSFDISKTFSTYHSPRKLSRLQKQKSKTKDTQKIVKQNAIKRLLISKAPPILTIHLKRFGQDIRGHLSKLSGHVAFQERLDLQPFLDPICQDNKNCVYHLVGIVEHAGTMRGGHYVSYVSSRAISDSVSKVEKDVLSDDRAWYCISDSNVRKATLQAVLNSEAYLLFYERCMPI